MVRNEWTKNRNSLGGRSAIPALAVAFVSKQGFACPPEHIDHLRAVLPTVDRIVAIGWRATDLPFLDLLRNHATNVAHVDCVTGTNPDDPLGRLAAVLPASATAQAHTGGFSQFIVNRALRSILEPG